ncbi:unnamed protein product, partial [marine sediment metagenome]
CKEMIIITFLEIKKMETATKTATARPISMLNHVQLANTLVNRFNGFTDLTAEQKGKIGMRFASISFRTSGVIR